MENSKNIFSKFLDFLMKILKWAPLLVGLSLVLIIIFIYFFFQLFDWVQGGVISTFGVDGFLAKSMTAIILALLCYLPTGKIMKSFLPLPQKNKNLYRAIFFVSLAVIFFGAYLLAPEVYFDRKTGQPVKYYSLRSDGTYKVFSDSGFDPETGDTLKPVTKEVIKKIMEQRGNNSSTKNGMVINQFSGTIFFAVSEGKKSFNGNFRNIFKILPEDTLFIDLSEGTHYFTIFDIDGRNLHYVETVNIERKGYEGYIKLGDEYNSISYSLVYIFKIPLGKWELIFQTNQAKFERSQ